MPNSSTPAITSLIIAITVFPGCGGRVDQAIRFNAKEGSESFAIYFSQRMPSALGGEENVFIERTTLQGSNSKFKIDHNGRFSRQVKVDSGNNGKWARVYLDQSSQPMVGESAPFRTNETGEISWVFKDFHTGQTSVSNVYAHTIIAFIDFESQRVINGYKLNSSTEERNSRLFGLVDSLPMTQTVRGETIIWKPTKRLSQEK